MESMETDKSKMKPFLREESLRWLWQAAKGKRRFGAGLLILQILVNLNSVGYALLFRNLIDRAVEKHLPGFYYALGALVALALGQLLLRAISRWMEELTRSGIENTLKSRLFATLLGKDYATVTAVHTGEWMNRLTSDTVVVADGMTQILPYAVGMLVKMAGAFCSIVIMVPYFGALIIPAGLVLLACVRILKPMLKRLHVNIQLSDGQVRMLLQERLDNLMIVRAFSQKQRTVQLAEEKMDDHRSARMKRNHVSNAYSAGFGLAMQGMYLLGAGVCGFGIIQGTISYGTMTAILQLIGQLQMPISGLNNYFSRWYAMLASAERLMEAEKFREDGSIDALPEQEIMRFYQEDFAGIRLEELSFAYTDEGDQITIRDLNMELRKGEFVAIVGHSGCGKSTLLKLLMNLYRPDSGRMLLLRRPPQEDRPLTMAHSGLFAYVPQGNQLMSGTIREILTFNDETVMGDEAGLWRALEIACADGFVSQLPQGLDTVLGEHGSGLSEGQIQRLSVARAIFSRRPVLLLDESTSALDEATERQLLDHLRTMTDRTVLIVTHRPRACEVCDRVVRITREEDDGGV